MFIFSRTLVIKPESAGFIEGIIFSWAVKDSIGDGYTQLTQGLSMFFIAFVLSFWIFQKNRKKIFYGIVVLTMIKWAVDVLYVGTLLNDNVDIKIWVMFAYFIGMYIVHRSFIAATDQIVETTEK